MVTELNDEAMRLMAELLKTFMPPGWAFTLLTFETNQVAGKVNYISSAERESMKETMQAMLDKWNRPDFFNKTNLN